MVDIVVGPRERTLTEKGKSYQLELRNQKQNAIYGQLTREIERVSLLLKQLSKEELERIRDTLDSLKGQFNEAHRAYEELLDSDEEKRSSYIWFDSRDREFMDFRMRICQQILRLEFEKNAVVSVHSVPHSAISRRSKGSSASSHARRIEVKARSARLKAEKEFFDREIEYKRFYLEKEIAINAAEEAVLDQLVMEENTEVKAGEMCSPKNKTAEDPVVKFENMASKLEPEPFLENPSGYTIRQSEVQSEILFIERLINIQDKQMELTAQIANQQRINSLPVQEPPVFSGNTFDYPAFVTAFDAIILNNVKKESDKLYFLNKYTAGKANEIVKGFLSLPENGYSMARKILDQRFGNPIKIGEAFKVRLRNWPQINDGNSAALQDFADFLVRCEEAMRISDAMAELNSSQILKESCAKLPSYSCIKWCRQAHDRQKNLKKQVKFHDFVIFVKEEAELATDPIFSPDALKSLRKNALDSRNINKKQLTGKPVNRVSLKTESKPLQNDMIEKRSPSFSCFLCKNNSHSLEKCSKFIKKNMDERRDFVRVNHLCFGCFSNDGHISKNCQNRLLCEECGKRHPTPLHYSSAPVKSEDSSKTKEALKPSDGKANSNAVAVCSNQDRSTVVTNCMILPVLLSHKEIPEKVVQVYAILDEASDTTFVKTSVMHDLGIEGTKTSLQLNTMLGREQIDVNRIEGLIVKRLDEQVEIELPKTYSRDNIPSRRDQIPTPDIADKWKHLKKIKDKLLPYQKDTEVGLLIGCNCPRALKPKEVILGKSEEPYAVRSILGWGIIGPVGVANEDNLQASCNRIVAQESVNSFDTLSFMLQANSKEIIDPVIISKFFEQDFSESKDHSTLGLSHEDRLFLKIVEQGISHKDNGHYELPLPFKTPNLLLPDNRHIVLRHLMRLKHKFASDPKYKEEYVDFMEKMISNGYAEKILNGQQEEEKVAWDDPVPIEIKARWQKWRQDLLKLEKISFPRCYKPSDFGSSTEIQLHHFADASSKGYGQCSYLRLRNEKGSIHCSLVFGKSRVNPLKQITIPRLELTAATVSVKISHQIRKELDFDEVQETFWTDSRVVLGYIANESKRFHTFVANRVQQIQDHTDKKQWRYVSSQVNPADHASRGLKVEEFQFSSWLTGPKFLWENESCWSCEKQPCNSYQELDINDPNVKKVVTMTTNSELVQPCKDLICQLKNISSWYRAKRVVALCIKFVTLCRNKVKESPKQIKIDLSVCDIEAAEKVIIKAIQTKAFQQEITALSTGKMVSKSSVLLKLNPQIDSDGVLRANGRLKYAQLPEEQKFPALLPKESHVTTLVIRHFHEKIKHQGRGMTSNEIRACGFWIVGGSNAVGKLIGKCVTCRKLRAPVKEQIMATLPEDRLAITPPFTNSAVDYFGPWIIKLGRKKVKRYGVLFTCLASRAIHLETATSLETDSFINALRRFICRRGPMRQLRSDQGTNFVGARRELKQALDEMDHEKVKSHLLKENCDWFEFKMNVPTASHMGGVWERQIKSVRNVLDSLLRKNGAQLDDESLRTLMCEAEAIVNGRPLTVDSLNDPDSVIPLTPNHILTMKSKIVLSPPGVFQHADKYCRSRWRRVQHLANEFWCRWRKEYLLSLQQRQKWTNLRRNVSLNDIVIIKDENAARSQWQLARVVAIYPSSDGCIRKVQLAIGDRFMDNAGKRKNPLRILERPIQKLVVLLHGDVS